MSYAECFHIIFSVKGKTPVDDSRTIFSDPILKINRQGDKKIINIY